MEKLSENPFYRKKIRNAVIARDTDKSGNITRADFELTVQRHKEFGAPEEKLKLLRDTCKAFYDTVGLTDDSKSFTYEEFEDIHIKKIAEVKDQGAAVFHVIFSIIDTSGDGVISYKEWETHYKALNIDKAHARASFDAMDTNGNGKISKEEFVAYHVEFYYTAEDKLKSSILYGPLK